MAAYQFSALSDGQAISFNPSSDTLNFDQSAIGAADLRVVTEGSSIRVNVVSGSTSGKDVVLSSTAQLQLATSNITFADGSRLLFGDNTTAQTADNNANALTGTAGRDLLEGFGGADTLTGGAGDDVLDGGAAFDRLVGGTGNDTFLFSVAATGANADLVVDFASGADKVALDAAIYSAAGALGNFAAGDGRFYAAAGATTGRDANDRVIYNTTNGTLWYDADGSGSGASQLIATLGGAPALAATDITIASSSAPAGGGGGTINGTAGNDTLNGTDGDDTINGLGGNDRLGGGDGADSLSGGDGNDTLEGGIVAPPPGTDSPFTFSDGRADTLDGGLGDDAYQVYETLDTIVDAGGVDSVSAENTDWTLGTGLENLWVRNFGGEFTGTGNELDNHLGGNAQGTIGAGGGTLHLHGAGGNDTLDGGQGFIDLHGDAGDDTLIVGMDGNSMAGGTGADRFVFSQPAGFINTTISDFASGSDEIHLDAGTMGALGASGHFAAGDARFYAAAGATGGHDADDRVIYDTASGKLYYDADGSGSAASQLIVTLQSGATVAAPDIVVENGNPGSTINGTAGDDSLDGTAGNDILNGLAGNDTLRGNAGDDLMNGGDGNDQLDGGTGHDTMVGGLGDDTYFVDSFSDEVVEQSSGGVHDLIITTVNNLSLPDFVNDLTLAGTASQGWGNQFDNILTGNASNNVLLALAGNDVLHGGDGMDDLWAGEGDDTLFGGASNDRLIGSDGRDVLNGGLGNDELVGDDGTQAADRFVFDVAPGAANADTLTFTSGLDEFDIDAAAMPEIGASGRFAEGDVRFYIAAGATGGHDADDRIVFDTATGRIYYDADGNGATSAQLIATLTSGSFNAPDIVVIGGSTNPGINGTAGNDTLVGTSGDDAINGLGGSDSINGGAGSDTLNGGAAFDRLQGGAGNDSFVFASSGGANADLVLDFVSATDKLAFDDAFFTAIGAGGNFAAGDARFYAAAGATAGHDANDRVIYNTTNGTLYYDADGSGSGAAQLIATIQGHPALGATDIAVI